METGGYLMKQKILMIGHTPPPPGGMATIQKTLIDSSLKGKYDLLLLDITRKKRRYKVADGVGITSFLYLIFHLIKLIYILFKEKPVIIHIQSSTSAFLRDSLFIILGRLFGKKIICHLHGFYSNSHLAFKYAVLRCYSQFIMSCVDILILLSVNFIPEFNRVFPKTKKIVIPNFTSKNILASEIQSLKINSKETTDILFVGRLSHEKGIYDLIKAVSLIKNKKSTRLLLSGLGDTKEDEERIMFQINKYGLEDIVMLLGYIDGQEKAELYKRSDIFVLPSHSEIFPVVILEAMASALPVIGTPVGAVTEIIENSINGFIVSPNDPESLAEKIDYLIDNPDERIKMGQNNLKKFEIEYQIEPNVKRISDIYQILL